MDRRIFIAGGTGPRGKTFLEARPAHFEEPAIHCSAEARDEVTDAALHLNSADGARMGCGFDRARPEVVIRVADTGSVDCAQNNREEACGKFGSQLIFLSTAVFSGSNLPYNEESAHGINCREELKLEAEDMVKPLDIKLMPSGFFPK